MAYNFGYLNNPDNIGYSSWTARQGGFPSSATDTGHLIAGFPDLATGYGAMSALALNRYNGGATTLNSLIAGPGGWTPGNFGAAANIGRTMGISPNADLNLTDPGSMSNFQSALTLQETGSTAQFTAWGGAAGGGGDPYSTGGLTAPNDYGYINDSMFGAGTDGIGTSGLGPGSGGMAPGAYGVGGAGAYGVGAGGPAGVGSDVPGFGPMTLGPDTGAGAASGGIGASGLGPGSGGMGAGAGGGGGSGSAGGTLSPHQDKPALAAFLTRRQPRAERQPRRREHRRSMSSAICRARSGPGSPPSEPTSITPFQP
jgi:hypothetical protein